MSKGAQMLRAWRGSRSRTRLANQYGWDPMRIYAWEVGGVKPRRTRAVELERVAGIPVSAWDEPPERQDETRTAG